MLHDLTIAASRFPHRARSCLFCCFANLLIPGGDSAFRPSSCNDEAKLKSAELYESTRSTQCIEKLSSGTYSIAQRARQCGFGFISTSLPRTLIGSSQQGPANRRPIQRHPCRRHPLWQWEIWETNVNGSALCPMFEGASWEFFAQGLNHSGVGNKLAINQGTDWNSCPTQPTNKGKLMEAHGSSCEILKCHQ